jgi:hypothetical protein
MTLLLGGTAALEFAGPAGLSVPEIDPGAAGSGLALIGGVLMIARGRRKAVR